MEVPSRHRPLVLLVAVILAQVLLLAFQIRRDRDVRLIRVWSAELLTPLQRGGTFIVSKADAVWFGYIDLRNVRAENRSLAEQLGDLRLKNQQLQGQAAQAVRLARLLGFRQANADIPMMAAEVIGANADATSRTVFINRGEEDGIRRNMAVITPDGVVGKISEALPHTSQVLLVTDRESGVGTLLAGTRTHGVVKGTGDPLLWMDYVSADEKVPGGEEVLTSGEDRIFPKNLPVGWVASTKAGFPFQTIEVTPSAHLDRLEEVLVLTTEKSLDIHPAPEANSSSQQTSPDAKPRQNVNTVTKAEVPASGTPQQQAAKPAATKAVPAKKVTAPAGTGNPQ
ncbi:MAG TPA: rod shape-determining protein MreC [Candidatus Acidoferrales bacterium]|nr:rod shape-determining protein MreC [Candidatus Acidoferrales bacterium]